MSLVSDGIRHILALRPDPHMVHCCTPSAEKATELFWLHIWRFGYHVVALCQCWVIVESTSRRCSKFSKCLARVRGSLLKSASFFSYNGSANSCKAEAPVQSCSCTFLSNDKIKTKKPKESTNIQYQNLPLDGL